MQMPLSRRRLGKRVVTVPPQRPIRSFRASVALFENFEPWLAKSYRRPVHAICLLTGPACIFADGVQNAINWCA